MKHNISKIYSLQALRYIAAILVVGFHTEEAIQERLHEDLIEFFSFGSIGVDIFFIISGFIIALATSEPRQTSYVEQSKDFFVRRLIRIMPIYWFYTILKILIVLLLPALVLRSELQGYHLFSSFAFLPSMAPWGLIQPILPIGWTLNFEMLFYIIFAIAILLNKNKIILTALAFVIVFVLDLIFPKNVFFSFYAQSFIFEFILGLIAFQIVCKFQKIHFAFISLLFVIGIALISSKNNGINHIFTCGLGALSLVLCVVYIERFFTHPKVRRLSEALGDSSYSLYLSHSFTVPFSAVIFGQILGLNGYLVLLLTLVIATISGIASYRIIEKPVITFLNTKWRARRVLN